MAVSALELERAASPVQFGQQGHGDKVERRRYLWVASPSIISEIHATLNYCRFAIEPRIRPKYAISDQDVEQLVALLEHDALVVPGDADVAESIPEDPADERVLACALDAQADLIISGDHHLLSLGAYRGIPILTVRQFLERAAESAD